jgi:hypothetical protein
MSQMLSISEMGDGLLKVTMDIYLERSITEMAIGVAMEEIKKQVAIQMKETDFIAPLRKKIQWAVAKALAESDVKIPGFKVSLGDKEYSEGDWDY